MTLHVWSTIVVSLSKSSLRLAYQPLQLVGLLFGNNLPKVFFGQEIMIRVLKARNDSLGFPESASLLPSQKSNPRKNNSPH
jgi:hypothetical protein